ncbi:MAG: hypothetical protein ACI4VQ_05010 [Clostridia bacterium]
MKNYEEFIDSRDLLSNTFALNTLLELGRRNLLNDDYYQKMLDSISETDKSLMTADYQRKTLKIAREMAKVKDKDLCEYIYDKVKADKKLDRGR